jgi:hypothetical protein
LKKYTFGIPLQHFETSADSDSVEELDEKINDIEIHAEATILNCASRSLVP